MRSLHLKRPLHFTLDGVLSYVASCLIQWVALARVWQLAFVPLVGHLEVLPHSRCYHPIHAYGGSNIFGFRILGFQFRRNWRAHFAVTGARCPIGGT